MRFQGLLMGILFALALASQARADMPVPVVKYEGSEDFENSFRTWTRYKLSVVNRADYDEVLFTVAPELPRCGNRPNTSRAWAEIFDANVPHEKLYMFCMMQSREDLAAIHFAVRKGTLPPRKIYVTITDRKTGETVKSESVAIRE